MWAVSGQWRAMPDGIDGIHGNGGNVVFCNLQILKELEEFESHPLRQIITVRINNLEARVAAHGTHHAMALGR